MIKKSKFGCSAAYAWLLGLLLIITGGCSLQNHQDSAEQVVLLHGLGRTGNAMFLLKKRIRDAGFETHRIDYASLQQPPDVILETVSEQIRRCCKDDSRPVHFVAHSLGGLIVRAYAAL